MRNNNFDLNVQHSNISQPGFDQREPPCSHQGILLKNLIEKFQAYMVVKIKEDIFNPEAYSHYKLI